MTKTYAEVYILDAAYKLDIKYTYFIPAELRSRVNIGTICIVPFGMANRKQSAVIANFKDISDYPQVKPIEDLFEYPINLTQELIQLCGFIKERFFCTFGSALKTILPPGLNLKKRYIYSVLEYDKSKLNEKGEFIYDYISCKGMVPEKVLINEFGDEVLLLLASLVKLNALKKSDEIQKKVNEKTITYYRLSSATEDIEGFVNEKRELKSEKQRKIFDFVKHGACISAYESQELFDVSPAILKTMVKNNILEKFEERVDRDYKNGLKKIENAEYVLNDEQQSAYEEIQALMDTGEAKAALLYGITGSGKTKIIIQACKNAISNGKTAMVLLPEIGLTTQALNIYYTAFGDDLAVIHSMLSNGERIDTFRKIEEGKIKIVIGTRSAVFAPLQNIGIIAIDEEQEHTYKSEMNPKYHTRDVVRFRCAYNKSVMLLCSATPAVESYYKAQKGIYKLIKLKKRYNDTQLPSCELIDLRKDKTNTPDRALSSELIEAIKANKEAGKQAILFVNRRGFNSHLSCAACGYVYTCPNCSVSLTYHAYGKEKFKKDKLICHYCGYVHIKPQICDACGSSHIGYFGYGTQKLQSELEEVLPQLKSIRMDADTTAEKHSHEQILNAFSDGEYDILFGTQMVAKGLDFPRVGLVGVVSADASLYMNDFRAGERTFSLFTQLIGRSGRSKERGKALLQTFNPDNEILNLASEQDYEKFYESEILLRKAVLFPPYCDIIVITFASEIEADANRAAESLGAIVSTLYTEKYSSIPLVRLGPYKEGILKLKNKYKQRIIFKYQDNATSRSFFREAYMLLLKNAPQNVSVDIDTNPIIV
ncbi:primosomal protein N' [Eubacteriales bacterium OttesenSCG-928-G02]|nr:primosomal protein N' [Eubacteriales bacterium OttesenSCG-928-G02]